jgi:cysteinyl-tRNA synthetase
LAVLFALVREINRLKEKSPDAAAALASVLKAQSETLGILQEDPEDYLRGGVQTGDQGLSDQQIEAMIQARLDARAAKNWAEADRMRDELQAAGIILEDGPQGTTWRRG